MSDAPKSPQDETPNETQPTVPLPPETAAVATPEPAVSTPRLSTTSG